MWHILWALCQLCRMCRLCRVFQTLFEIVQCAGCAAILANLSRSMQSGAVPSSTCMQAIHLSSNRRTLGTLWHRSGIGGLHVVANVAASMLARSRPMLIHAVLHAASWRASRLMWIHGRGYLHGYLLTMPCCPACRPSVAATCRALGAWSFCAQGMDEGGGCCRLAGCLIGSLAVCPHPCLPVLP